MKYIECKKCGHLEKSDCSFCSECGTKIINRNLLEIGKMYYQTYNGEKKWAKLISIEKFKGKRIGFCKWTEKSESDFTVLGGPIKKDRNGNEIISTTTDEEIVEFIHKRNKEIIKEIQNEIAIKKARKERNEEMLSQICGGIIIFIIAIIVLVWWNSPGDSSYETRESSCSSKSDMHKSCSWNYSKKKCECTIVTNKDYDRFK